jgi:hypothetical protein
MLPLLLQILRVSPRASRSTRFRLLRTRAEERQTSWLGRTSHGSIAGLDRRAGRRSVLRSGEQMRIDRESHARVCMSELARHEHHIESLGDQQRGEPVAQAVKRESAILTDPGSTNSQAERFTDLALIEAATGRGREDEVIRTLVRVRQPSCTQQPHHRRSEHDLPSASFSLESGMFPVARQLTMLLGECLARSPRRPKSGREPRRSGAL